MARVLLILPGASYRTNDFVEAAHDLGIQISVATEAHQTFAESRPAEYVAIDLDDTRNAATTIADWAQDHPIDAVLSVDDPGVVIAALAARQLGLTHNPPDAVAATRNKAMLRRALVGVVPQPSYTMLGPRDDPAVTVRHVGLPAVIKPLSLSASRGVIRVDHEDDAEATAERVRRILAGSGGNPNEVLLVEHFIDGPEVAVDGLLQDGEWTTLAVFDKPDPLDGPYFAETIYTTPSRHHPEVVAELERVAAAAATGLGLRHGAVHVEMRVHRSTVVLLELAARSIGGLCGRALRFGLLGNSLESLLLRHATGQTIRSARLLDGAAGVMMVPVPSAGTFGGFRNEASALDVPGITAIETGTPPGTRVVPLPIAGTYLGFVFARAATPGETEDALRTAAARLEIVIE